MSLRLSFASFLFVFPMFKKKNLFFFGSVKIYSVYLYQKWKFRIDGLNTTSTRSIPNSRTFRYCYKFNRCLIYYYERKNQNCFELKCILCLVNCYFYVDILIASILLQFLKTIVRYIYASRNYSRWVNR